MASTPSTVTYCNLGTYILTLRYCGCKGTHGKRPAQHRKRHHARTRSKWRENPETGAGEVVRSRAKMIVAARAAGATTQTYLASIVRAEQGGDEPRPTRISQPRVAPRPNLVDAAVFCHAVSELLLADGLTKLVVATTANNLSR